MSFESATCRVCTLTRAQRPRRTPPDRDQTDLHFSWSYVTYTRSVVDTDTHTKAMLQMQMNGRPLWLIKLCNQWNNVAIFVCAGMCGTPLHTRCSVVPADLGFVDEFEVPTCLLCCYCSDMCLLQLTASWMGARLGRQRLRCWVCGDQLDLLGSAGLFEPRP